MRRISALLALALLAACNQGGGTARPSPTPASVPPRELPGATCEEQRGGDEHVQPDFIAVEVESEGGIDRVSFHFRQRDPQADQPPAYIVRYVKELLSDGEGAPVDVEGNIFLAVSFQAVGVDLTGEEFVEVYTGPKEFTPGFPTVREVEQTGDFEGVVSWGIGLSRAACVKVSSDQHSLTLEFPSA